MCMWCVCVSAVCDMFMCAGRHKHVCAYGGQKPTSGASSVALDFIFRDRVSLNVELIALVFTFCPVDTQHLPVSAHQSWRYRQIPLSPVLYAWTGDLNSGPLVFSAGTVFSDLSPSPYVQFAWFWFETPTPICLLKRYKRCIFTKTYSVFIAVIFSSQKTKTNSSNAQIVNL